MPKYIFDFDMDCYVKGVEIEANSLKEAKEILNQMDVDDILDEGYVKQFSLSDIDYEEEED